jgi:hypothetical protein
MVRNRAQAQGPGPGPGESRPGRPARLPWAVLAAAGFVLVFGAAYSSLVFERVPHFHDEAAYLFQARIFLTGHFSAPVPCGADSFDFPHMVNVGRWYSIYPPGFPMLLAAGLGLGVPWLVNPLLGALAVILIFLLGAEAYSRRVGILAAVLAGLSLWMLLLSSSLMSHTAAMAAGTLFLLFLFRSLRAPTAANGLGAGLGWGLSFLVRPYDAVLLALPFAVVLAVRTLRHFRARWKNAAALALAAGLAVGCYLLYNRATTGSALEPGYIARYGSSYSVLFGRAATLDYDFTPHFAVLQIGRNLRAVSRHLFGWPVTSLWLLVFTAWGWVRRRGDRGRDLLVLSGFLSTVAGFTFFWGAFLTFGARMLFDSFPLLVLLSARGLDAAPGLLAGAFPRTRVRTWNRVLAGCLAAFSVYAFAVSLPGWAFPAHTEWYYDRYDHNLAGSSARLGNAVRAAGLHGALVLVKFLYAPTAGFPTGWWGSGFMHDTPALDGDVIYANDRGPEAARALARCYPGRALYLYWGTLERGVLAPLRAGGGADVPLPGPPVTLPPGGKKVDLLASPREMFKVYSEGFGAFLEETLRDEPGGWPALDSPRLTRIGLDYAAREDYRRAAFAFEAALQVEMYPNQRHELLGQLARCYAKIGQRAESKRLMLKMAEVDFSWDKLYRVFPERGF